VLESHTAFKRRVNRLSQAAEPLTVESISEVSLDRIAAFSPQVVLVTISAGARPSDRMLGLDNAFMVDGVALATAQLKTIYNYRQQIEKSVIAIVLGHARCPR